MPTQATTAPRRATQAVRARYSLSVLAGAVLWMLAGVCGAPVAAPAPPVRIPRPLRSEIIQAWRDAGARPGWMKDVPPQPTGGYEYWEPFRDKVEPGAVPAFRFHREDVLTRLPDPGAAFGLDFHCSVVTGAWLKKLSHLKSLRSLNVGGSLVLADDGLKELKALKSLQGLYLFYSRVTDAGLKELAGLKDLRALDLYHTRVRGPGLKDLAGLSHLQALNLGDTRLTDAGLKHLARLKSLRWLNLHRTRVTAAGVARLQKELPKCKIITGDD